MTMTHKSFYRFTLIALCVSVLMPHNVYSAIENKSSQFSEILGDSTSGNASNDSALAAQIRAQRDAINARDSANLASTKTAAALSSNQNACDMGLRKCMQSKCGNDFTKCSGDTDTAWGTKMDTCRRDTECNGEEYKLFTTAIKEDRDMNARVAMYTSIVECGNSYNDCIITECGTTFSKCLGKSAGDAAIKKCEKIAKNCTQQDNGLTARMMNVFGALRQNAEKDVVRDEKRLHELRDEMTSVCKRLGATLDTRTMTCVYTVEFYAGDDGTLMASKKAYAGSTFKCDQEWFGIDVTTFKENAYRLTRAQSSASSAMLGSGVGMAAGAITSGAIDRAVERTKAEKELKKAQKDNKKADKADKKEEKLDKKADKKAEKALKKAEKAEGKEQKQAKKADKADKKEEKPEKKKKNQTDNHEGGGSNNAPDTDDGDTDDTDFDDYDGDTDDGDDDTGESDDGDTDDTDSDDTDSDDYDGDIDDGDTDDTDFDDTDSDDYDGDTDDADDDTGESDDSNTDDGDSDNTDD